MLLRRLLANAPLLRERDVIDVRHENEIYRVLLRRSAAARRFTLRVRAASHDVVLTLPARASLHAAQTFADRHGAWIGARLRRLPAGVPFEVGAVIPLRGAPHAIVAASAGKRGGGPVVVARCGGEDRLIVAGDPTFAARRVRDFLIREARRDLHAAVERHAARLGVHPRRITLRDTSSRWGSCSASGALNFSWRLILAPPHVLAYLAVHEVAHLVHLNHSRAFWAVVERLDPHYEAAEAWLRHNGSALLRYGESTGRASADANVQEHSA